MMTVPLETIRPAICDGSEPTTRFSVVPWAFGSMNRTVWAEPTLKLCQSMAARWVVWLIVVCVAELEIVADPATTVARLRATLDGALDRAAHPLPRNGWKLDAAAGLAEKAFERLMEERQTA